MSEENNSRTNIEEDFDDGFNPDDLVNDEKTSLLILILGLFRTKSEFSEVLFCQ